MSQESKSPPAKCREQIIGDLSDLLMGISLIAGSIGRLMKGMIAKGETADEEKGHDSPD